MKTKIFIVILFVAVAFGANAQSNDSTYINKAIERLAVGDCESAQRFYNVYKEMSGKSIRYLENEIKECFSQKEKKQMASQNRKNRNNVEIIRKTKKEERQSNRMNDPYFQTYRNNYIAWGIVGRGYPRNIVTSIESRNGGIIGIGLFGDLGIDYTEVSYSYGYNNSYGDYYTTERGSCTKTDFRYAGGIRFYPYRGVFFDIGYGTIVVPNTETIISLESYSDYLRRYCTYDDYDERWIGDIEKMEKGARDNTRSSHGFLFHAGYNLVTNLSGGKGFFLGICGGVSYDVINKVYAPSINLKVGLAWRWK